MRVVSTEALTMLQTQNGIEPINIIQVFWTSTNIKYYSDKFINTEVPGKILEISSFDDVVNIDGHGSTQSVTLALDDTDGSMQLLSSQIDFYKCQVKIYQWFEGLPINDMFLLFAGYINTPISYSEGDRTFKLTIVSKVESQEVGFSPEEGLFNEIPDNLIGQAWPLPFGTCLLVPALKLDPIPAGVLLDSLGVPDPSLLAQEGALVRKIQELTLLAQTDFYNAIYSYHTGMTDGLHVDDYWQRIGDGWVDKGNEALHQCYQAQQELAQLITTGTHQKGFSKSSMRVQNGSCFPEGHSGSMKMQNGTDVSGQIIDGTFIIDNVRHPAQDGSLFHDVTEVPIEESVQVGGNQRIIQQLGFVWEPADQPFQLSGDIPIRFIAAMLPCQVLNVWAYKNFQNTKLLVQVPIDYYVVSVQSFGSLHCTMVTLPRTLSSYRTGWEDDIFVDLISPIGPNTIDILEWIIRNYTTIGIDATSFATVRSRVAGAPSNFCLLKQEDVVKLLGDIAYQARCYILLKNNVFYMEYLPGMPTPTESITLDDIIVNTLEVNYTPTEEVFTKYIATYKTNYSQQRPYKIILRNNITKYGLIEQSYDWYIYTNPNLVDLASTFWMIRKSNTWKIISFKTPLHKIRIEAFDGINITIPLVANGTVIGIVQSVKLDTKELTLEFTVWLPVRSGTMVTYDWAWPLNSTVRVYAGAIEFQKPGSDAIGNMMPANGACDSTPKYSVPKGERARITDGSATPQGTADGQVLVVPNTNGGLDTTARPSYNYNYRSYVAPAAVDNIITPMTVPATIGDPDEDGSVRPNYTVNMYMRGLTNPTSKATARNIIDTLTGPLQPGTFVMVSIITWTEKDRTTGRMVPKAGRYILPATGSSVWAGQVVSGTAATYQIKLYRNGPDNPPDTTAVSCTQLQIDPNDIIPAGTWALVTSIPGMNGGPPQYIMQVPVFLE